MVGSRTGCVQSGPSEASEHEKWSLEPKQWTPDKSKAGVCTNTLLQVRGEVHWMYSFKPRGRNASSAETNSHALWNPHSRKKVVGGENKAVTPIARCGTEHRLLDAFWFGMREASAAE